MKNQLFILVWVLLAFQHLSAQTSLKKVSISGGFGFQQYAGDLGNGFYKFNSTEYGVASLSFDYYLNPSFDLKMYVTLGDLGYCSDKEEGEGGVIEEVLNSRMATAVLSIKYKLANGYILPANKKVAPYIYLGAGYNRVTDIMKMGCIIPGNYYSANGGFGLRYHFSDAIHIGYHLAFGYFTSDRIDFMRFGRNDIYMQNSLMVGVNL